MLPDLKNDRVFIVLTLAFGFVACLAAAAPRAAQAVEVEERLEKTVSLSADGEVELATTNGGIEIATWNRDEVRIEATKKARAGSRARAEEILDLVEIRIDARGDRVEIETEKPRNAEGGFLDWIFGRHENVSVSYRVTVPEGASLDLGTVNGGVSVQGAGGTVRVRTTNGGVTLAGIGGAVDAATTNGAIRAELVGVPEQAMRLATTNGGLTLTVPRATRASLDASTTNGGISVDGLDVDVARKSRRHLEGAVNGGGVAIRLSTTNGGIKIRGG